MCIKIQITFLVDGHLGKKESLNIIKTSTKPFKSFGLHIKMKEFIEACPEVFS